MAIATHSPAKSGSRFTVLSDSFVVALSTLRQNKLRSLLTMLGVIIGVCAVSIIVLINSGFQEYIKSEFASLSADSIFIVYDPSGLRRGEGRGRFENMNAEDRDYLVERATMLKSVTGISSAGTQVAKVAEKELKGVEITGIEPAYYNVVSREIIAGRGISQNDVDNLANVAVISTDVQDELFPNGAPALGQTINLPGIAVTVVGIMKLKQQNLGPSNNKVMELPVTTVQRKIIGGRSFAYMMAKPKEGVKVSAATEEIWQLLMRRSENKRVYRVNSSEAVLGVLNGI
ncbi:MAG: ABC transporter permease, partial [Fimbriimonadaceae bacterium]|nr:ABC transporter permease [Fimbriimonadaceae bacterium]